LGHESTKTLIERNTAKFETPKIIKFSKEYELWLRYVQIPKKDYCTSILSERLDKHELHHRHPLAITANTCKTKISQRVLLTNKKTK
jgi:hypothetical protein